MDTVTMTTQEVADKMGVPKEVAYVLLQYLEKTDLIKRGEPRKPASGKGQGQVVYVIPGSVCQRVKEDLETIFKAA